MNFRPENPKLTRWTAIDWCLWYLALTGIGACLIAFAINLFR